MCSHSPEKYYIFVQSLTYADDSPLLAHISFSRSNVVFTRQPHLASDLDFSLLILAHLSKNVSSRLLYGRILTRLPVMRGNVDSPLTATQKKVSTFTIMAYLRSCFSQWTGKCLSRGHHFAMKAKKSINIDEATYNKTMSRADGPFGKFIG